MRAATLLPAILVGAVAACGESKNSRPASERTPASAVSDTTAGASARAVFVYDTASTYIAEIWDTDSSAQAAAVTHARRAPPGSQSPRAVVVLRAYNGQRVVRLTRWDTPEAAAAYAAVANTGVPAARYVEELRVRSLGRKAGQPLVLDTSMAAQFSQFTMRRKAPVDTLQAMAAGMAGGMVQAEPTLKLISTLTARDSSVVAFVGVWDNPKGFEVFAERKTFTAKPYWEPFAGNEHHMMAVVAASTRM